jgi:hypothetical protein
MWEVISPPKPILILSGPFSLALQIPQHHASQQCIQPGLIPLRPLLAFDGAPLLAGVLEDDGELKMAIHPEMSSRVAGVLYALVMVAVIVGIDFLFFRNRFWERLISNIGIVLLFAAFYLRFLRHP